MPHAELIELDTDDTLPALLRSEEHIGVDTEFMREKTFFAELCLVQIATPDRIYCADPLNAEHLENFWNALMSREWVVHSARQDIEVLYQSARRMPAGLFDTQIAAALLGHTPQIGYAGLVAALFDVQLAKSHTRADWSRRPLPPDALAYAAEDVEYLLPARDRLDDELERRGRRDWVLEDSADLLDPSLYEIEPGGAIGRLKAASNLQGRQRATAAGLAEWREREALRSNRPRQWVMRDAVLLDIVRAAPATLRALAGIPGLAERTVKRAGDDILEIVRSAPERITDYRPPERPDESQKKLLKRIQSRIAERAEELGIAAEILAPRRELSAALFGGRDLRLFRGWRKASIGDEVLSLLEGG